MAYNVSDKYKQIRYSGDNDNQLYLEYNGVEVENASTLTENLRWERRILKNGSKTLTLDNFVSQTIELVIRDYNVQNLSKEFYIKIGSMVNGAYEYAPLGYYHIKDNPSTANGKITYKLIDRSTNFDIYIDLSDFIKQNGGKITKLQAVQKYCELCGVEFANTSFLGSNEEIGLYDNTITARTHISYLAECAGCFATIGRDGKLYFIPLVKPNTNNTHIIPEKVLNNNMTNSKDSFKISKVVYEGALMPFEKGDDTGDTLFINTSNLYISKQEDIDRIYTQVVGLEIDNISTNSIIGDPSIDPWDYIQYTHTDDDGNILGTYTSLAQYSLEFNGAFKQTFSTTIDRESKKINSTVNSDSTKINRLKQEIDTVNGSLKVTSEKVDEIQKDITTSKTTSGNPIEVTDAGEYPLESIGIEGKSYQKTTTGKQLIKFAKGTFPRDGIEITVNSDGSINLSGTPTEDIQLTSILVATRIKVGNYSFRRNHIKGSVEGEFSTIVLLGSDNYTVITDDYHHVIQVSTETMGSQLVVTIPKGTKFTNYTIFPQLEIGDVSTEPEMFTGCLPSPNPDYPSEIKTVQGVTNEFDGIFRQGSASNLNDNNLVFSKNNLFLKKGRYTFKTDLDPSKYLFAVFGNTNKFPNTTQMTYNSGWLNPSNSLTFNFAQDLYFGVLIRQISNETVPLEEIINFKFQLEEGPIAHRPVPYGRWLEQITHGKNFLRWEDNFSISANNTFIKNIYAFSTTILTKDLDNMILSGDYSLLDTSVMRVAYSNEYPQVGIEYVRPNNLTSNSKIIKINKNYKYVTFIAIRISSSSYEMIKNSFQLEKGTISTEYEEYKENTALIDMNKDNLFDKDDYNEIIAYFNSNHTTLQSSSVSKCIYIPIVGGNVYTVEKDYGVRLNLGTTSTIPAAGVSLIDNAKNQDTSGNAINSEKCSLLTSSNAKYLVVQYISTNADTKSVEELRNSIKIYEGYEPYYEFAEEDEFLNEDLTANIQKLILTGDENWIQGYGGWSNNKYIYRTSIINMLIPTDTANVTPVMCTHYKAFSNVTVMGYTLTDDYGISDWNINGANLIILDKSITTVADFKTFLKEQYDAGTPVIVYYKLAESKTYKLNYEPLKLHKGYNYITLNDDLYPNMNLKYLTDSKFNADYATKSELNMKSNEIMLGVKGELKSYSTTTETNALIDAKVEEESASINLSVTQKIDDIQIGGTNIALDTNNGITGWSWGMGTSGATATKSEVTENGIKCCKFVRNATANSSWSVIGYSKINRQKYLPNKKYTISFEVKASVVTAFNVSIKDSNAQNPLTNGVYTKNTVANTWTKLSVTLTTVSSFPTSTAQILYMIGMNSSPNVSYIFRNVKIEEGNKATDWSPAPEDKLDTSKFVKAEIIAEVNNGVSNLKFYANNIKFEGLVTANNNFKILTDGSMEAKNGSFTGVVNANAGYIGPWIINDKYLGGLGQHTSTFESHFAMTPSPKNNLIINGTAYYMVCYLTKDSVYNSILWGISHNGDIRCNSISTYGSINVGNSLYVSDKHVITGTYGNSGDIASLAIVGSNPGYIEAITVGGDAYGVNIFASDKRLKRRIKDSKYNALDAIMKIKHRQFIYRKSNEKWNIGVIADELQEIDPNLVFEVGPQKIKNINSFYWQGIQSKAIQELYGKIKKLTKRVEELEKEKQNERSNIQ